MIFPMRWGHQEEITKTKLAAKLEGRKQQMKSRWLADGTIFLFKVLSVHKDS